MSKYLDSDGLTTVWGIITSTFAASMSIDSRTISLKNKSGDVLSTVTVPSTATALETSGTIKVNLASTTASTYTSGGNITPGISGTLAVSHGGTGKTTLTSGKALIGAGTSAVTLRDIFTLTSKGNLGWSSATNEYLLTKGALAYWNGAYGTSNKSNIEYLGTVTGGTWQASTIDVAYGGTGQTTAKDAGNSFLTALDTSDTTPTDSEYLVVGDSSTFTRRTLSTVWNYFDAKGGATYLPLAGGTMTGALCWANGTALSRNTTPVYLLGMDAFADGGTTHYSTMSDIATALSSYVIATTDSVINIPANANLNDYTTTGIYRCALNSTAATLTNAPTTKAFTLLVMPTTSNGCIQYLSDFLTSEHNIWQRSLYNDTWGTWMKYTPYSLASPYDSSSRLTSADFTSGKFDAGSMFHFTATSTMKTGKPYGDANVLQMNWDYANGYDSQLAIGTSGHFVQFRGKQGDNWNNWTTLATINWCVCNTAADTTVKEVTTVGNLSMITGTEITVKFKYGNTASAPTLKFNSASAKAILYKGTGVDPTYIKAGDVVKLVYNGSQWEIVGSINSVTSYGNHIDYYISENGSDTNDGLSTSKPFATLEKFFEVTANSGYTDCRCYIMTGGTYYLNKQALNNVTLHLRAHSEATGNIVLKGNYGIKEDWIMYNAHVKLTGTANAPIVYEPYEYTDENNNLIQKGIYFENSAVTLDYVTFQCRMQGFGCYIKADNITAERLHFSGCTGYLNTITITNNSHKQHAILLDRGNNMRISGTLTVGALTTDSYDNDKYFMYIQDSDIVLQSAFPTTLYNFDTNTTININDNNDSNRTTYSYAYGIRSSNSEITGTRIRLASYVSRCVNKTLLADEETELNVTWGGKADNVSSGRAGFTSVYGIESIMMNTDQADLVSANAIKTWTISASNIVTAVASDHQAVGNSKFPYKIIAVVPVSTSDNRVIIKNATVDSSTGNITVVGRNVSSTNITPANATGSVGVYATVNVLYTMLPFSITYHS